MMRRAALCVGVLLLAALWLGPLPERAPASFAAHMTLHMGVVAVAAPLVAVGLAGGRRDPTQAVPWLFSAIPAAVVELAVVWAWHAPALHHAARASAGWLVLEQGSFAAAGLLVWVSALGGEPTRPGDRAGAGVIALLLTSMHMTLLGALLALAPRPLYHHAEQRSPAVALDDQHVGGAIMLTLGGASYLIGGLALSRRMLGVPARGSME